VKVIVITIRDVLVDHGIGAIHLNGVKEVRNLRDKLRDALFDLKKLDREQSKKGLGLEN